jgi:IS605 OrfB family transposase
MLRRKKGHFLVTKTQRTKLLSDKPDWLNSTQLLFNQVIEFYVDIYHKYPELANVPSAQVYSTIEPITIKTKNRENVPHPLPYNCPMVFRRAAIKKALGMFKSWQTSYQSWANKCDLKTKKAEQKGKKAKLPRPPLLPRKFNSSVTLYKGMYEEDIEGSIILKLWTGKSWAWVKPKYQDYKLSSEWIKSSPTLVIKNKIITLNWCYEKLVKSNGQVAEQIKNNGGLTVCSVDLNLDGDIAVGSILKVEGTGRVTEKKRLFIKGNKRHQHLRKRLLGRDALAKSKINSSETLTNANANLWRKLKNREKNEAERVSRRIVDFAHKNGAKVLVFEHLSHLKPKKGKYSRRSNQKRAYWLKSKIYQRAKDKALNDYGIYTVRVSPRGTSREFAYTGKPILRGYQTGNQLIFTLKGMGSLILSEDGLIGHCDLNSARNIGLRYLSKYYEKPTLVTERFDKVAKQPTDNRVASILLKGGGNPCDFLTLLRSHISGNYVTVLRDSPTEESPKNCELFIFITI